MTEQEMRELAIDLYISITKEPDQAVAHVKKVMRELSAKGQWEQFEARVKQGDGFNHSVREEAELRMGAK